MADLTGPAPDLTPLNPRGDWDRTTIYSRGDFVSWNGSSYVALTDNIGDEPVFYSVVWQVVAEQGNPGESLNPRGEWNRTTIYYRRDVVGYSGESYIAVTNSIGVIPRASRPEWILLSARGAPGASGEGPTGPPGPTGPQGPRGIPGSGATMNVYDDGVFEVNADAMDFTTGIDVSVSGTTAIISAAPVPVGTTVMFPKDDGPYLSIGTWLPLEGQALDRVTYAELFALIGTTYGAGDGVTTFNIPDMRSKYVRGYPT